MAQVFISYVEEDGEVAQAIAHALEAAGYSTWYYERDSLPGLRYLKQVADAIEAADALLILISPNSVNSGQVTGELDIAYERGKHLLPVRYGITHAAWQERRPDWRQALTTVATILIPSSGPGAIVPRLVAGLGALGVQPSSATVVPAVVPQHIPSLDIRPSSSQNSANYPKTKINPIDGAEMIYIPPGPFLMGDDDRPNNPRNTVTLSGYYIYRNLVTLGQYKKFVAANSGSNMPPIPPFDEGWKYDDHPMVNATWPQAVAYAAWANGLLPSEAQWEKAARGTEGRMYPWGNEFDISKLWCSKAANGDAGGTIAVGTYGVSLCGCTDMAGNLWQWCRDWYDDGFWKGRAADKPNPENQHVGKKEYRVVRGGSWYNSDPMHFRSAFRDWNTPTVVVNYYGFRCVVVPDVP